MENKARILYHIEVVEDSLSNLDNLYGFEQGIIFNEQGVPADILSIDALKEDTKDLIKQIENDCIKLLESKKYIQCRLSIQALEKLQRLEIELNR